MKLGSLIIEFLAKGQAGVQSAITAMGAAVAKLGAATAAVGSGMAAAFAHIQKSMAPIVGAMAKASGAIDQMTEGSRKFSRTFILAFAGATASLAGFIRAGLHGTAVGDMLSFRMGELSRNIAGLFRPELDKLIESIRNVVNWFRGLSDEQRENIARWIQAAAAAGVVVMVMPKVIAAIGAVVIGVKVLTAAFLGLGVASGGILPAIGAVVTAVAALGGAFVLGSETGRSALGKLWDGVKPIMDAIGAIFGKLQEAFAPVMDAMVEVFGVIASAVQTVMPYVTEAFTILGEAVKDVVKALTPVAVAFAQVFGSILKAVAPLFPVIAEIVKVIADLLAPVLQIVGSIVAGLAKLFMPLIHVFVFLAKVIVDVLLAPLKAIAWVLEQIAKGIAFITGTTFEAKVKGPEEKKKPGSRSELLPSAGGLENVTASWERIVAQSTRIGKTIDEQILDEEKAGNDLLRGIHDAVSNQRLAIAGGQR